jgi:pSer/pThr/pTyr-binding forkhead associated (FHA) protein
MEKTKLAGRSPGRGAWLFISEGSQAGRDFRLGHETTVGRDDKDCDVVLKDGKISAKHARIKREGEEFVIYDLASLNGTFVNRAKIQRQILSDDDEIVVGDTTMGFKVTPRSPRR